MDRKRIAILGCTGSVGSGSRSMLSVKHSDKLQVVALSAHSNTDSLVRAARELSCPRIAVTDPYHADDAVLQERHAGTACFAGSQAAIEMCLADDVDIVVVSIVGAAGLDATYQLISAGKTVALANKESLVVGGTSSCPWCAPASFSPSIPSTRRSSSATSGSAPRRRIGFGSPARAGPSGYGF